MKISTAKNLFWSSEDNSRFDCEVQFVGSDIWYPFACLQSESSVYSHVKELWDKALSGEFGEIKTFVAPPEPDPNTQTVTITPSSGSIPGSVL